MKYVYLILAIVCLNITRSAAQVTHSISGTVVDSTKLSLPGSNIKMRNELGDSSVTIADINGKFTFPAVKGSKITLFISSIGFEGLIKHYTLQNDGKPVTLDPIVLRSATKQLGVVTIVGVNPVVFKEDTIQYSVSAYKVRENAPVEDVLKKIPGLDVDKDGNVSAEGKQVTKVRVNGKDFFGGDVQSATKNLPADVIESVQIIDDYGDQANLTGIKTGEPNKILNFTIRKDKNYGYFGQATAGDGRDLLPKQEGVDIKNDNRYIGLLNFFKFKGDQQISVLGNLNNTNVNTFSYGSANPGGGGGGFGGGRGGGRGNALRGGSSSSTNNANGITNARSIGLNFRDQWGKSLSVYGSYSFSNNTTFTNSTTQQTNNSRPPSTSNQASRETNDPTNHRFNFNVEWKPDTLNYLKVTPTFNYSGENVNSYDDVTSQRLDTLTNTYKTNLAYTSNSISTSSAPNYGVNGFYNHRFKNSRRNLNIGFNANSNINYQYDNPIYNYPDPTLPRTAPENQIIYTDSRTNSYGVNLSYQEPIGKVSFLEFNYAFNHSFTSSDKESDTLYTVSPDMYHRNDLLSNKYNYTFTTNRFGINYRIIESKYNLTLGIGGQPSQLDGVNLLNNVSTKNSTFNIIPAASFNYKFSRSQALRFNYNGSNNQPAFNQLQPVIDFSNALYPVQGNPNLSPEFTNNLSLRYNAFSFQTGNIFLVGLNFTQTDHKIVQNIVTYGTLSTAALSANPSLKNLQNATLVKYLNADGYYSAGANFLYSKPWSERKYTLIFGGQVNYTNNIGFSQTANAENELTPIEKNIAKTLTLAPQLRFRVNVTDIIDAEVFSRFSLNKTNNSIKSDFNNSNSNIRTFDLGVNGKNYVWKDWTLSYDYTKTLNYGYSSTINVKNPNIFNAYVERRFLKDHRGTLRLAAYDIFNENTGFSIVNNGTTVTETNVNKLGRYFLLSFTFRLQKFSGKAPSSNPDRGFRGGDGGGRPQGGPPAGGPPGGGPM